MMMSEKKPILVLDFDGVVHSYSSGWKGATVVPDPPTPGALAFLKEASERFKVAIFSSRTSQPGGVEAMRSWLMTCASAEYDDVSWLAEIAWPSHKPPAHLTIDDRAICFDGTWPSLDEIAEFEPWHKVAKDVEDFLDKLDDAVDYMTGDLDQVERDYWAAVALTDTGEVLLVARSPHAEEDGLRLPETRRWAKHCGPGLYRLDMFRNDRSEVCVSSVRSLHEL